MFANASYLGGASRRVEWILLLRDVGYTHGDLRDRKVFARRKPAPKGDEAGCVDVPGRLFENTGRTVALATEVCLKLSIFGLKGRIGITYCPIFGLKAFQWTIS
jgi:hypothetical protein